MEAVIQRDEATTAKRGLSAKRFTQTKPADRFRELSASYGASHTGAVTWTFWRDL